MSGKPALLRAFYNYINQMKNRDENQIINKHEFQGYFGANDAWARETTITKFSRG